MKYRYGEIKDNQFDNEKQMIRKRIYFLLLYVDPKTKEDYQGIDVNAAFENVLHELGGLNNLFSYPLNFLRVMSLLEAAQKEYNSPDYSFSVYRKLILDAGSEVLNLRGGE